MSKEYDRIKWYSSLSGGLTICVLDTNDQQPEKLHVSLRCLCPFPSRQLNLQILHDHLSVLVLLLYRRL